MKKSIGYLIVLFIVIICYFFFNDSYAVLEKEVSSLDNPYIEVHFLDVGQGDSIFIEINNSKTMLIDASTSSYGNFIIDYINSLGYDRIDYLIATHPHADHIGSMQDIVLEYDIGDIYMSKVSTNTKTYENLLTAIDDKNLTIKKAYKGVKIIDEDELDVSILSPTKDEYDNLNNYSAVLKLTYKNVSYLFMGDSEEEVEENILDDVKADVIKIAHHGSNSSSSLEFLKKVSPTYAVISVGEDNSYNHPHKEVLDRLEEIGSTVYRTDLDGNIIISTDGNKIMIDKEKK